MPTQRDIREKALLALFAHATDSTSLNDESSLWALCLEPQDLKITKLSIKAIKHQLQSLPKWSKIVEEHTANQAVILKTYEHKAESRQLVSAGKSIEQFTASVAKIGNLSDQNELHSLFLLASTLGASINSLLSNISSTTYTEQNWPPLEEALRQVLILTDRVDFVASPLEHKTETTISALIKATDERETLKQKAKALAEGTIKSIEQIDPLISANLANFSEEQIGKVELNLLRLATYELTVLEVPKAIVINEALELSRKFATDQAVPLINGVLDKVS